MKLERRIGTVMVLACVYATLDFGSAGTQIGINQVREVGRNCKDVAFVLNADDWRSLVTRALPLYDRVLRDFYVDNCTKKD